MPKIFTDKQKDYVRTLAGDGLSNVEIASKMKELYPEDWTSEHAHRTVARMLKDAEKIAAVDVGVDPNKTLDEMSREERFRFIESRLEQTPRFRMVFRNFNSDQKGVFIDEYLTIIRSTETLTEAEEQALFAAILELILSFKALDRKEQEEMYRDQTMEGLITEDDVKYRRVVDDKYQREYDQHMKLYQKGMSELKMSRSQRLKEIRTQKRTLVDVAEELSHSNAQAQVADEIERLAKEKDSELKRLLDLGHIHGVFEGY